MKRPSSCDSLGALMSMCPGSTDEQNQENINPMYTREFQTMLDGLDEEGCVEEAGHVSEKKRRLGVEQVKALEKNFEVENKLEPERKVKLAQELGLQPRQVAVWFQNRRARWKTKQLERDYGVLKAKYDGLQLNYESLKSDNEALLKEIRELKSKLNEDDPNDNTKLFVKEEPMVSESEEKSRLETNSLTPSDETAKNLNFENLGSVFVDFKDGSSDESDSSAILNNEDNNLNSPISSGKGVVHHSPHQFLDLHSGSSNTSMNINFQFSSDSKPSATTTSVYQPQFVKIEEHNFFGEESCSTLFSDDQAPTLHWYCSEDWN